MKRLNITFYDEIIEKLETRTKNKKCSSMAQSVRELVDLGLQVEEASARQSDDKDDLYDISFIKNAMKSNMKWTLETLLITRQLIEFINDDTTDTSTEILQQCKEKATNHIKKCFETESEI